MSRTMTTDALRIVLGDQLGQGLLALREGERTRDTVLLMEVADETRYVPHHKKKIAFILSAMRAFARDLREAGLDCRLCQTERSGQYRQLYRRSPACGRALQAVPGRDDTR